MQFESWRRYHLGQVRHEENQCFACLQKNSCFFVCFLLFIFLFLQTTPRTFILYSELAGLASLSWGGPL